MSQPSGRTLKLVELHFAIPLQPLCKRATFGLVKTRVKRQKQQFFRLFSLNLAKTIAELRKTLVLPEQFCKPFFVVDDGCYQGHLTYVGCILK